MPDCDDLEIVEPPTAYQWASSPQSGSTGMKSRSELEADGFRACVKGGREVTQYKSVLMKREGGS